MSTYKNYAAGRAEVVKEWIVREGVVGTAHYSQRHERWVDFRPAKAVPDNYGHNVAFWPAKGVEIGFDAMRVHYATVVAVDYAEYTATCAGPIARPEPVEGSVPETWVFRFSGGNYMPEISGFPIPEEVKAARAAEATARAAAQAAFDARYVAERITEAAFTEWIEGLTDPQERRWVSRWLNTDKAWDQVSHMAHQRFPSQGEAVRRMMVAYREKWASEAK